ncbi:catabolite gene activator protein [Paenibacillus baekrokdamisoli]|uniref:Catabolite gene activator protein n=1 Tax=Paenibacillus baekrokdamisoli TaxID=1712516 RepID=A0A3G9J5B4_9BACL|nr:cyclic nucleotide-binding domain-containing protein [Paenibacillus baekrokdamisoli]MBB3068724.1 CRP-like cAMP-binding protein [Paenibacillus baekrokdamisoli]BBH23555.1 catabolite gene activator protein [Paenibacillus baekrokdamisoli]
MQRIKDAQAISELLRSNNLLTIFRPQVVESMELRIYGNQETICTMGDTLDGLYVLVTGKLKIYTVQPNGKSILLRFTRPPSLIGDVEWMGQYPVKNIVEAVGQSSLLLIKWDRMLEEEMNNPAFLRFIIENLSRKMYTLSNASAMNLLYPVENRFASYLMSLLPQETDAGQVEEIRTSSLMETADMLGTSYRHLNRVIKSLIQEGVLQREKGRLLICNEQRLKELANNQLYT